MVSSMRRVAAISAGPRSASPRGNRALNLLDLPDLLGLSAISVYIAETRVGSSRLMQRQGSHHAIGTDESRPQRSRSLLDSVHAQPRLQGGAPPDRARQGHA